LVDLSVVGELDEFEGALRLFTDAAGNGAALRNAVVGAVAALRQGAHVLVVCKHGRHMYVIMLLFIIGAAGKGP
jgi:hypothetical protein